MRVLTLLIMVTLVGGVIGAVLEVNPLWVMGALLLASLLPGPAGALSVSLVDLARPIGSNPGAGGGVKSEIILIPSDCINWTAFPDRVGTGEILTDIPLKTGKYMHRFYMTPDVIEPAQKKIKASNKDSGGWEVTLKGFYPGFGNAIMSWIALYGYAFEGLVIIQNCADSKRYVMGEPCNAVYIDDIQSAWGATVEKEKGHTITFGAKQKNPMGIYTGVIKYDPTSASW